MSVVVDIQSEHSAPRVRKIKQVLWIILALNLIVATAKLTWGLISNSASMTADGFHSLFDGTSNVVGLVGMGFAARPADEDHPYGHTKYETYASLAIAGMLLFAAYSIGSEAVARLIGQGEPPQVSAVSFIVMAATLLVNIGVTLYERKVGKALRSEILIADASHTASDILVSLGVVLSLILVKVGFVLADALISLGIALVIIYTAWGVIKHANATLSDSARLPVQGLEQCANSVKGVFDTHHIRTRGSESEVYVDLHIMVDPDMTVAKGHELAHDVEKCIYSTYDQVVDVVVHVEPYVYDHSDIRGRARMDIGAVS